MREIQVPELLQWKEQEGADDISALMKSDETEKAKEEEKEQKKLGGETRVPELLQWKDQEMADDMEKLMATGKDGNEKKVNG
jgi:hypothetical protein